MVMNGEPRAGAEGIDDVIAASPRALPATASLLRLARPLADALSPVARDLAPILDYLSRYREELVSSWAGVAALTEATEIGAKGHRHHYVRLLPIVTNELLAAQARRLPSNRANAYPAPRWLDRLRTGLEAFDCRNTSNPATVPVIGTGPPPCKVQPAQRFGGFTGEFPRLVRMAAPARGSRR